MDIHSPAKIKFSPYYIFLILLILSVALILGIKILQKAKEVTCTLEAKLCPDGSTVGRVPPYCNFAPCPITLPKSADFSCISDDDCVLVNGEMGGVDCCGVNNCQPIVYAEDKWIPVNKRWQEKRLQEHCSNDTMCPNCFPRIDETFKAECVNGKCDKIGTASFY